MKLFKTNNIDHVKYCQHCFSFDMPSKLWQKRVEAFEGRFSEMYHMHFAEFLFEGFNSLLPTVVKLFFFVYFFIYSLCIACIVTTIIGE